MAQSCASHPPAHIGRPSGRPSKMYRMAFPPAGLPGETDRRAASGESAMHVLVLAKVRVFRGYAYVSREEELVRHVPRVAMNRDDQWLPTSDGDLRYRSVWNVRHACGLSCLIFLHTASKLRGLRIVLVGWFKQIFKKHSRISETKLISLVRDKREPRSNRRGG
jgi:hypothetical protein